MKHLFAEIARKLAALASEDQAEEREAYLETLTDEELATFVEESTQIVLSVRDNPAEFVNDERTAAQLRAEMEEGVAAIKAAKAEIAFRADEAAGVTDPEPAEELSNEDLAASLAELANEVEEPEDGGNGGDDDPDPEDTAAAVTESAVIEEPAPVVAAAPAARRRRAPARAVAAAPQPDATPRIHLTAAASSLGADLGQAVDPLDVANMMVKRHDQMGPGGRGFEKFPIAKASWKHLYGEERALTADAGRNMTLIASALDERIMRQELERRAESALVASGGLCAPGVPIYTLQQVSQAARPVRDTLTQFLADRGAINAAAPASLADVMAGDAVGRITEADDGNAGSATKTCQIIDCPDFTETAVAAIYHCLQFGNLGARAFPELVAQWNQLVLAAHARTSERALLDGIAAASTAVTAANLGLGASATLPSQIITAAAGMRSRHRMDPEAVLRVMLPAWVLDLLVSDMYRTQFQRFDMTREQFVATLRAANVEPSFYLDTATGAGQEFTAQAGGALQSFPSTVVWYMFPEGSFLFLDSGSLELGLVRDSVLNETNDFQIFGETWENVAFVGVESIEVTTTVCDSGTVSLPDAVTTCSYSA